MQHVLVIEHENLLAQCSRDGPLFAGRLSVEVAMSEDAAIGAAEPHGPTAIVSNVNHEEDWMGAGAITRIWAKFQ